MVGSGLKKMAKEAGLKIDKGVAYGEYMGIQSLCGKETDIKDWGFLPDAKRRAGFPPFCSSLIIRKCVKNTGLTRYTHGQRECRSYLMTLREL